MRPRGSWETFTIAPSMRGASPRIPQGNSASPSGAYIRSMVDPRAMALEEITRVAARFVVGARDVGFAPPPVPLRARIARAARGGALFLHAEEPLPLGRVAGWLEPWRPVCIDLAAPRSIRADFDALPAAWDAAFASVTLDAMRLDLDGRAALSVSGTRASIAAFARRLRTPSAPAEMVSLGPTHAPARLLTPAQEAALRAAVAHGYYRVPRPLNLHDLAALLGIGSASLSERLRRAEGRVMTRYVEDGWVSLWDERAPYEAR